MAQKEAANEIAKQFMEIIAHDAGAINREEKMTYPEEPMEAIGKVAIVFFDKYPSLLTEYFMNELALGDRDDNRIMWGELEGFEELCQVLDNYFDSYIDTYSWDLRKSINDYL